MILPQSFVLYSLIECLISIDIFSLTMFMKTVCQVIFMNRKNIRRHCPCSGVTMRVRIFIQDRSLMSNFVKIFFHMLKIWRFPNFLQNSQDPKCFVCHPQELMFLIWHLAIVTCAFDIFKCYSTEHVNIKVILTIINITQSQDYF